MSTERAPPRTPRRPCTRTPNSAARPVPAMIAAGVASPSAHGHAINSTAVACSSASPGDAPAEHDPARGTSRRRAPSTIGTKTAEIRSASRCTGAFDPCADWSSRTISASFVLRADLRDEDHQTTVPVDRGADHLVARTRRRPAPTHRSAARDRPTTRLPSRRRRRGSSRRAARRPASRAKLLDRDRTLRSVGLDDPSLFRATL